MYFRRKSVKLALDYLGIIYLILIVARAPLVDAEISRNGEALSEEDAKKFSSDTVLPTINEANRLRSVVMKNRENMRSVTLAMLDKFKFPTDTILRSSYIQSERSDPVNGRFRRNDNAPVTQNGSTKDYMSTYYAQRKAIMDKYTSQQKEIRERLKNMKSLIATAKKRNESRKIVFDVNNSTRDPTTETLLPHITDSTTENVIFNPTTANNCNPGNAPVPTFNSTTFDDTQITVSNNSQSFLNSSEDETVDYNSYETDFVTTSSPTVYETLRPPLTNKTDKTDRPDVEPPREETWQTEAKNLMPQNEVDLNLTEPKLVRKERNNDTLIIDLGGQFTSPSVENNSVRAFEQLEEMFFWDQLRDDEGISDINEPEVKKQTDDNSIAKNLQIIPAGNRSDNASQSSDSFRVTVEIKSSPEIHLTKNVKNLKTSTTTYRNSSREVFDIHGTAEIYLPSSNNINLTNPTEIEPSAGGGGGGATEAEWCEECPHDYRWGNCGGSLFYVHNAFLRNKGPSAIDAVFGMNVDGPISITCVEAVRYNQTRGIASLHSGGPGHDFAKVRIRGFQGEGFSYIMKVWGLSNEEFMESTSDPY